MMSRDVGVPGSPSGAAVRANNIEVTAAENGYTSSSVIKLDKVHVLRQTDMVEGQGITTASVSNGRGVRVSVKPDDLNALGYVTTSTIRTIAGEPLYVTSHTLNYVDIGTTGGVHPVWGSGITFEQRTEPAVIYDDTAVYETQLPAVKIVTNELRYEDPPDITSIANPHILQVIDAKTSSTKMELHDTYGLVMGGMVSSSAAQAGLSYYGRGQFRIARDGFDGLITGSIGSDHGQIVLGDYNPFDLLGLNSFIGDYGLFYDDAHGFDGVYCGDPQGLSRRGPSIGHMRAYGNMLADPNNNDRYGTTGTINIRTNGVASDNVLRMYTDANGVYLDSKVSGDGYPTQAPAKVQFNILDPTYVTGQLGASGDIYTSGSVFAGNDVNATDDIIATDLVQGADVTATDDVTAGDDVVGQDLRLSNVGGNNTGVVITSTNASNYSAAQFITTAGGTGFQIGLFGPSHATANEAFFFQNAANPIGFYTNATKRVLIGASGGVAFSSTARLALNTATPPTSGAYVQTPTVAIGTSGATVDGRWTGTNTVDVASIAAGAIGTLTVTVTGASTGDDVDLGPPAAIEAGLTWCGFVSAANTVTVRIHNTTGAPIDPASATWRASCTSY
jgi:hypothetical protein